MKFLKERKGSEYMALITSLALALVGLGGGYIIRGLLNSKYKGLSMIEKAVKKKNSIIFLETPTTSFVRPIVKMFQNIGITDQKEIIIFSPGSLKTCANLGIMVAHGDLYRSMAVPLDVPKTKLELGDMGLSDDEIAELLEIIQKTPKSKLKGKLEKEEIKDEKSKEKVTKYNIYLGLSSVVKDFVYTGLNRVSIQDMLRNLVAQRELENMGKNQWINNAIAIFIVAIGIAFAIKFAWPVLMGATASATSAAPTLMPVAIGG